DPPRRDRDVEHTRGPERCIERRDAGTIDLAVHLADRERATWIGSAWHRRHELTRNLAQGSAAPAHRPRHPVRNASRCVRLTPPGLPSWASAIAPPRNSASGRPVALDPGPGPRHALPYPSQHRRVRGATAPVADPRTARTVEVGPAVH